MLHLTAKIRIVHNCAAISAIAALIIITTELMHISSTCIIQTLDLQAIAADATYR